jgi:hypothetical protein
MPGIEPGPLDLQPGTLNSRPLRQSTSFNLIIIIIVITIITIIIITIIIIINRQFVVLFSAHRIVGTTHLEPG